MNKLFSSIFGLLAVVTPFPGEAYSDTFEFLTYTPPPGWTKQDSKGGIAYRRPSGIGLITFYPSYPTTGSAADEFAKMWRARIEPVIPAAAPQPQIQPDGEYAAAIGTVRVDAQGTITSVVFVAIVGRGRAIGVLTMSAGDEVQTEVTAFLDSLSIKPGSPAATTSTPDSVSGGDIAVEFDVPAGYVSRREGRSIVLIPTTVDNERSCAYGISPPRESTGDLEKDARAAFLEAFPGWQIRSNSSYAAMRGVGGGGWPYFWHRTDVERLVGGSYEYANAMTTAFPGAQGQVNILFGIGNIANCRLNDINFSRLFHSLRPRGWTSDGGKALARDLQGTWRLTESRGLAQYKFKAANRYEYGMSTITSYGLPNTTYSSVSDGRWELRGSELILTADKRGVQKYKVRIYEETDSFTRRWKRAMSLLDENALEVQYMRVVD